MNVRRAQKLRNRLLLIGIIMMLCSSIYEPLLINGIVVACTCLIPHFLFNKCPHCGKQLGNNEAKCCQHCGKDLDSKEEYDRRD